MKARAFSLSVPAAVFLILSLVAFSSAENRGITLTKSDALPSKALGTYHALIVGINDYEEWNPLQTAVKDATAVRDVLVERYGFDEKNVILRTDREASRGQIIRDLRSLAASLTERDNLLVYFAGHGQLDDLTGDGYWVPVEGRLKDPSTWISHAVLKGVLGSEKVLAKNVVVIADSCYSGTLLRGGPSLLKMEDRSYLDKLNEAASRRSRQVITSGGLEPVADGGRGGHSLFAYYLIRALEENDREVVDLENLFHTRVWEPVTQVGNQRPNVGRLKTPMDEDGQFVLHNQGLLERKAAQAAEEAKGREAEAARLRGEVDKQARIEAERAALEADRRRLDEERRLIEERKQLEAERLKIEQEKQRLALEAERRKLEQEKARIQAETAEKAALKVASLPKTPPLRSPAADLTTIAVLPWDFKGLSSNVNSYFTDTYSYGVLVEDLYENRDFRITHSTYSSENVAARGIERIQLSPEETGSLWTEGGVFSKSKPNAEAAAAIGRRLGVDLVLMIQASGPDPLIMRSYLIETATGKWFDARNQRNMWWGFGDWVASVTREQLQSYLLEAGR